MNPEAGSAAGDPRTPARSTPALLLDRTFGVYFFGKVATSCGVWIQNVTAAIVAYELTGSTLVVGAVSVTQFAGPLALSLWTGALADRFDRRVMILVGRLVSAVAALYLSLVTGLVTDAFLETPVPLLAATLVMGIGFAVSGPAMQAIVPSLVPDVDLEQAVALNTVVANIARAIGPAAAAGLILWGGAPVAFLVAAGGHATFAAASCMVRSTRILAGSGPRGRVLDGVRFVWGNRMMRRILLGVAALGFGVDPVITLTPALAEQYGGDARLVGTLASSFGLGAVVASLSLGRLRTLADLRRLGLAGFLTMAGGLAVIAWSTTPWVGVAGFGMSGTGFLVGTTALTTRLQRGCPEQIRGKVMALWTVAYLGSRPVAALVSGSVTDLVDVRMAVVVGVVVCLASAALAAVRAPAEPQGTQRFP